MPRRGRRCCRRSSDAEPIVQGRAAEALGLIGDRGDAPAIGAMVQAHVAGRRARGHRARRSDLSAGAAGGSRAPRAVCAGAPRRRTTRSRPRCSTRAASRCRRWWPVAYALQRVGDARAAPALLALLDTPGRYTAAFAVRGLAAIKAHAGGGRRCGRSSSSGSAHPAVVIQAMRALAALGDAAARAAADEDRRRRGGRSGAAARGDDRAGGAGRRRTASTCCSTWSPIRAPAIRGAAMRRWRASTPTTFMATLAGLDADRDWTVRVGAGRGARRRCRPSRSLPRLTADAARTAISAWSRRCSPRSSRRRRRASSRCCSSG